MTRWAGFLRGVTPMNLKMADLRRCLEEADFSAVVTVLSSGNVVFDARGGTAAAVERRVEAAMAAALGRSFMTIVRRVDALRALLDADPFRGFRLPAGAKRIVTFLRDPGRGKLDLPVELHGAQILAVKGGEVFSAYVATPKGPVFMSLIERTFGQDVTTRTWDTVRKVAAR